MVNLSPSRWKELWCWGDLEPGDSNGEEMISTHRNQQDRFYQSRATSTLVDSLWRLTASARSPGHVQDEGNNSHLIELFGECNEVINANTIASVCDSFNHASKPRLSFINWRSSTTTPRVQSCDSM